MKNLNKLGFILGIGTMSALSFSLAACGDDPATTAGTAGTGTSGTGTTAGTGGSSAGTPSTGGSASGGGGAATGGGGAATGGGGSGGASGGMSGGGGSGGAAGGSGGGGGTGGAAPSAACMKLCMGADSIVTVCAAVDGVDADLKVAGTCLQRCGKEADAAKVKCWQDHVTNYKNQQGDHCLHAGGDAPCTEWPAL